MNKKRVLQLFIVFLGVVICVAPIALMGFMIGVPIIRDWQVQRSIVVVEGAEYLFDNARQFGGNYKQKNFFYWSRRPITEIRQFYQSFTTAPFIEVNSYDARWLISAWKGSVLLENPIRDVYIHTDLCDYHEVFECMSIALIDGSQLSLPNILQNMYSNSVDDIQSLPNGGTLIVFSYNIPDLS
jgi:hypothetical protein